MLQLINDTLVRRFKIDATANGWGVLEGTIRPAVAREIRAYDAKIAAAKSPEESIALKSKFYAEHIKTWSLTEQVTAENVEALPIPVWDQLDGIVLGYTPEPLLGNSDGSSGS